MDISLETRNYFRKVYAWMALGLGISALTGYVASTNATFVNLVLGNFLIFIVLVVAEIGLVILLAGFVKKISANSATFVFLLYCFVTGLTLSVIFLLYTLGSIAVVLFITAGMFAVMSLFGFFTKKDLSGFGRFLIMALFGLIIASLINLFFKSAQADFFLSIVGVLIFSGLTAYDTQKLKALNVIGNEGSEEDRKEAIIGALTLYLDFINLFLDLLRIMGRRRN